MGQIRMNADELEACAKQLDNCRDDLCSTIANMDTIIKSNMRGCWEGKAVVAYGDQFDGLKPGFDRAVEVCCEISAQARQVCANFRELDEGMAGSMGV